MEERIREEREGSGEGGREGTLRTKRKRRGPEEMGNASAVGEVCYVLQVAQWYHVCHQRRGRRSMLWRYGTTDEESIYVF